MQIQILKPDIVELYRKHNIKKRILNSNHSKIFNLYENVITNPLSTFKKLKIFLIYLCLNDF